MKEYLGVYICDYSARHMILQLSVDKNLWSQDTMGRHIILMVIVADKWQMALCPLNSNGIHVILAEVL